MTSSWTTPPEHPAARRDEVHVWRVRFDDVAHDAGRLLALLSPDERDRADRIRVTARRDAFTTCRGLLRTLLARYVDAEPGRLRFRYGPYGKPALDHPAQPDGLEFNLSHSGGLALLAVTRGRAIGVDVERLDPHAPIGRLADRVLSPRELETFRSLPEPDRARAFFAAWTCKESIIKAREASLFASLHNTEVALDPDSPARLLAIHEPPGDAGRWRLERLAPAPGYAAALAVERHDWRLRCWTLSAGDSDEQPARTADPGDRGISFSSPPAPSDA